MNKKLNRFDGCGVLFCTLKRSSRTPPSGPIPPLIRFQGKDIRAGSAVPRDPANAVVFLGFELNPRRVSGCETAFVPISKPQVDYLKCALLLVCLKPRELPDRTSMKPTTAPLAPLTRSQPNVSLTSKTK
ncbi:hypothetical protein Baya_16603 [Bagarius yarrelli]|uniref:Uncharacterized protein n=1 Tax=Bagarius yarrelli TaxID=175774 RepID=A0A556VW40_BAGYA|nr:hypothetical protein Baya_16603 [Bagarius yarrelli]